MAISVHTHRFDQSCRILRSIRKALPERLAQIGSTLEAFADKRAHEWPSSLQLRRTEALLCVVRLEQDSRKARPWYEPNGKERREAERVYCKLSLMDIADIARTDC